MRCRTQLPAVVLTLVLVALLCEGALCAASPQGDLRQVSLEQYHQEFSRIYGQLKALPERPDAAGALRSSIPDEYQVETSSATFHIDNRDLKYNLDRYISDSEDRAEILPEIELKVEAQIEGVRDYGRFPDTSARPKLDSILAQREYANVKTQSPLEKLKDLALGWLIRLLKNFFENAAAHPRVSRAFVWTLIGLVTLGLVCWLYALLRRTKRDEYAFPSDAGEFALSHKRWQQWLAEARAAADRGECREAVHLAYWAGIAYLETSGAWKPDRARTPREYLRILPKISERRGPLTALTGLFESIWYARQPASPADFEFSLSQLEKIGCR
jgi:hypothetical protein